MLTRGLEIAPTLIGLSIWGAAGVGKMLVLSQVVLSLQLPFAIVLLVLFTGDAKLINQFANLHWLQNLA